MTSIDWSKPVQTRDGRKARVLCTDADSIKPIVALARNHEDTADEVYSYFKDGRFNDNDGQFQKDSDYNALVDLINVTQTRWVNLYRDASGYPKAGGCFYPDLASAKYAINGRVGTFVQTVEVQV